MLRAKWLRTAIREGAACLAILVAITACGSPESTFQSPVESLTPMPLDLPGPQVKTAGIVLATSAETVKVRVEPGNQGSQAIWNDAVVLLRVGSTTVFTWTTTGTLPSGASAASAADLEVGERLTFSFDPRERKGDGSYEASVIGRRPK